MSSLRVICAILIHGHTGIDAVREILERLSCSAPSGPSIQITDIQEIAGVGASVIIMLAIDDVEQKPHRIEQGTKICKSITKVNNAISKNVLKQALKAHKVRLG